MSRKDESGISQRERKEQKDRQQNKEAEIEYIRDKEKTTITKKESNQNEIKKLRNNLKRKASEIKHLKEKNEKGKERYLRLMAEMENLRKRTDREKNEFYQYALNEIIRDFLIILDNFERALESKDNIDGKGFREGIEMIYKQYKDMLMKQGVSRIEIKEKKFDPNFHQAVTIEESEEVEEPEVMEEVQRGYMLHNKLLRPVLVKVVIPKKGK